MRPTWRAVARRLIAVLAASLAAAAVQASGPEAWPQTEGRAPDVAPVATIFRAFDGAEEVTAATRVRVTPSGAAGPAVEADLASALELAPALYDVQALRAGEDGVVSVKRLDRVSVMHYPDEGGQHLEVINFQPGYGALQLRPADEPLEEFQFTLFPAGDASTPVAEAIAGDGYVLFVVPAGRYDVRVDHAEHGGNSDTHWLIAVEVPAGRTRLKLVGASG